MRIFGLEIRLNRKARRLSGAAAQSAMVKAAGKSGKISGPRGKKRGYSRLNSVNLVVSKREKQLREAELDLKLQEKMVDIAIKQEELHARRNGLSSKDPVTQMRENIKAFREMKDVFAEMGGSDDDDLSVRGLIKSALPQVMQAFGPTLGALAQQGAAAIQQNAPQIDAPAQIAAPQPAHPAQPQGEPPVDLQSAYIISQLNNKSPEQAARWLVAQNNQNAQAIVVALIQTPDAQIPQLLGQLRQPMPGLASWLEQRLPLLIEVAHVLRAMNQRYVQPGPGNAAAGDVPL